jgi:hypothetical protein
MMERRNSSQQREQPSIISFSSYGSTSLAKANCQRQRECRRAPRTSLGRSSGCTSPSARPSSRWSRSCGQSAPTRHNGSSCRSSSPLPRSSAGPSASGPTRDSRRHRCMATSRPSGTGWRSPPTCLRPTGISMTCSGGAWTIRH